MDVADVSISPGRSCNCRSIALVLASILVFQPAAVGAEAEEPVEHRVPLLDDLRLQRGVIVWDPAPGKHVRRGVLQPFDDAGEPVWGAAQWHSRFSLAEASAEPLESGEVRFADGAKWISFAPSDSEAGDFTLGVDACREFEGRLRGAGDPWPHLLVERRLLVHPSVPDLRAVRFQIAYRLAEFQIQRADEMKKNLHAAQFLFYLTVQNRNRQSPGHGDYVWFGIPLYDSRYRQSPGHAAPDIGSDKKGGTGKFIFNPPASRFTDRSAHDGDWVRIDADLLPLIREALDTAWKRGYLPDSRDPADYRLGGMNLGWEVTGLFRVAMQVEDLQLQAALPGRGQETPSSEP